MTMSDRRTYVVTGGAGFIGSAFVRSALAGGSVRVVTLDKLTYAGNLANLRGVAGDERHVFVEGDVCDRALLARVFEEHRPLAVVHFAAESHVDRSIDGPRDFVQTNLVGTFELLEAARHLHAALTEREAAACDCDCGVACDRRMHSSGDGYYYGTGASAFDASITHSACPTVKATTSTRN